MGYYIMYKELGVFTELYSEGNIYIDQLPEHRNSIAIFNQGGDTADVSLGYKSNGIQLLYRGDRNPIASYERAIDIFDVFNGIYNSFFISNESLEWGRVEVPWLLQDAPWDGYPDGGANYILSCLSPASGPQPIGTSQKGHYEYSMNFMIDYKV
jgi:hypothetical protein